MSIYFLLPVDVYDPSCWTIVPVGFNSACIFAAYGDKIYKIDHIQCKEMVNECVIVYHLYN